MTEMTTDQKSVVEVMDWSGLQFFLCAIVLHVLHHTYYTYTYTQLAM